MNTILGEETHVASNPISVTGLPCHLNVDKLGMRLQGQSVSPRLVKSVSHGCDSGPND